MFKSILLLAQLLMPAPAERQVLSDTIKLNLNDVILIAKEHSTAAVQALTIRENQYWQYKTFKSNYSPQLILDGTLPQFSKTNIPVIQPDGTVEFKPVTNDNSQLNLGLTQNIGLTGGQVFLKSNVLRFSDFDRKQTRYNGNPFIIGINQPLFAFNALSWDKKIEPLRYEESLKKYREDMEVVGRDASELFFSLLIAQINRDIAAKNLSNNETIYKIGEGKAALGRLSKDELLRLKLGVLNARKAVAQANVDAETSDLQLKSFIGFSAANQIQLLLPENLLSLEVDKEIAVQQAKNNRQKAIEFKRALLEADKEIAKAKGENGLKVNLFGSFGLTNVASQLPGIYSNPKDQQEIRLGFQVPILDWGRSASRIKTAQSNRKLVEANVKQAQINFEQEIYTTLRQLTMIKEQMQTNAEADLTANERFEIAKKRYFLNDLSITDLNIALQEKDQARRDYIFSLKSFWNAYFNIRVLTLYDFTTNKKI
ncbi:Outer membrane efflux protein [Pedobacter steynii]|uniref:Outer membrane efflux protein n=1 Tax=Pedobacter steynii TaxID=430522 RepID=A0A1G9L2D1_9SPHI|nr:TolC family protein [Pedobacter steynii]SDL56170.1 Outer membrane efflux protein [Pedobacter steynii]